MYGNCYSFIPLKYTLTTSFPLYFIFFNFSPLKYILGKAYSAKVMVTCPSPFLTPLEVVSILFVTKEESISAVNASHCTPEAFDRVVVPPPAPPWAEPEPSCAT